MYDFDIEKLSEELKRDEGVRKEPYKDSMGNLTIGVGHLLTGKVPKSWTDEEIDTALQEDIRAAYGLVKDTDWYSSLDTDARRRAVVNMAFNLGHGIFLFKNFIRHIKGKQWSLSALDLNLSLWHQQVGARCSRIMRMISDG